jgi:hypothetical protein
MINSTPSNHRAEADMRAMIWIIAAVNPSPRKPQIPVAGKDADRHRVKLLWKEHSMGKSVFKVMAILGALCAAAATLAQPGSSGTKTWKAFNGKYALRTWETTAAPGARPFAAAPHTMVQVAGLGIDGAGNETQAWQWTAPTGLGSVTGSFRPANALVSDFGKCNVLLTSTMGNPLTPTGQDIMPPQVIILDGNGQVAATVTAATWWKSLKMNGAITVQEPATVTAATWWKSLKMNGAITVQEPATMRFLGEEKFVEIKLASGTTVRVNTASGDLTIDQNAAGKPSPASLNAMAKAVDAGLHSLALRHPNPYIRDTAYHDHDNDWTIDAAKGVFSLVIRDPQPRTVTGVVSLEDAGWRMTFDDEQALTKEWTPPADAKPTVEQAVAALMDMSARWGFDSHLAACGEALKSAVPVVDADAVTLTNTTRTLMNRVSLTVNLKDRTFRSTEGAVDVFHRYDGMFGWDKEKHWMAWPLQYIYTATHGGIRGSSSPAIPKEVSPPIQPPPASTPGK